MKVVFKLIVIFHGLIHLLGFLKSFQLADISQLQEIPKTIGVFWLIAAILFLLVFFLLAFRVDWWWMFGLIGTLLSQTLIIFTWQEAKTGTVANMVILFVVIFAYGAWNFNRQSNKAMNLLESEVRGFDRKVITEKIIDPLPLAVQKWFKLIGLVGSKEINIVSFRQSGMMRLKPEQKEWYSAEAQQLVTIPRPAFIWKANVKMNRFVHVAGKDIFHNGTGKMLMKLGSLIPVAHVEQNKKVNQSTLQRYMLELLLYPSAALQPYITWEDINPTTAKATMTYKGTTGSATYHFDNEGELIRISAMRYKDSDESALPIECIAEIKEQTLVDGVKLPTKVDISWMLKEGKFTWYTLTIHDIHFN